MSCIGDTATNNKADAKSPSPVILTATRRQSFSCPKSTSSRQSVIFFTSQVTFLYVTDFGDYSHTVQYMVSGIFVPKTIRSLEHSFPWWNFHSRDHSFPVTFITWTVRSLELSFSRLFVPWNIRSLDLSFPGTFVPGTLDLSCRWTILLVGLRNFIAN